MSFVEFLKIMWSMWLVKIVVVVMIGYGIYEWSSERKEK
jgi:Na+/H+ antiporter NhaD/arsenite permease-like protein